MWQELVPDNPMLTEMLPGSYRCDEGFELDVYHNKSEKVAIVQFPYRPNRVLIKRTIEGNGATAGVESGTTVMTGSMSSLDWSGYDASIGQKALKRYVERRKRRTFRKRYIDTTQSKTQRRLSEPVKSYSSLAFAV